MAQRQSSNYWYSYPLTVTFLTRLYLPPLWNNSNKYRITKIRTRATQALGWNVSFISLVQ